MKLEYKSVVKTVNEIMEQYTTRLTVRQIYYRCVSPPYQLFPNTRQSYKGFDNMLTRAREKEDVDWRRIEDRARRTEGGDEGYSDPEFYVASMMKFLKADFYDRKMWLNQPQLVEVWVEKDALAALFSNVTSGFRTLLFPTRGYSSFTGVMEAITRFNEAVEQDKPVTILHFTDHDPSGLNMTEDLENRLRRYRAGDVTVKRVMLTIEQVKKYGLAPNPTKKKDSRTSRYVEAFGDECWELDAVDPAELQKLVEKYVMAEVDEEIWNRTLRKIAKEKKTIGNAFKAEERSIKMLRKRLTKRLGD